VDFTRGQRKDDVMHQHLAGFEAAGRTQGVVFIGRAQEKTTLFRTEKRHNAAGRPYPWIVKATGVVNHFYFYCVDADFRTCVKPSNDPLTSRFTASRSVVRKRFREDPEGSLLRTCDQI